MNAWVVLFVNFVLIVEWEGVDFELRKVITLFIMHMFPTFHLGILYYYFFVLGGKYVIMCSWGRIRIDRFTNIFKFMDDSSLKTYM